MPQDWHVLTKLTGSSPFVVERVRMKDTGVAIEGAFDPPPLAQLAAEDQVFVAAFVRCHGSIKDMEEFFGVSYPTIKNRLNRIGAHLPFAELAPPPAPPKPSASELLTRIEKGEMTARDVLAQLRSDDGHHD